MEPCGFNLKESNHGITFIPFLWLQRGQRVNTGPHSGITFSPRTVNGLTLSQHNPASPLDSVVGN